jgi:ATP-dependent RNA helicase RhlE
MKTTGRATSFVTREDRQQLRDIERLLGHVVPLALGSARPASPTLVRDGVPHWNERPSSYCANGFGNRRRPRHRTT